MLQVSTYRILVLRLGQELVTAPDRVDLEGKALRYQLFVYRLYGLQHVTHQDLLHSERLLKAALDFLYTDWRLGTENECLNMVLQNIQGVKVLIVTLKFCFDGVLCMRHGTQSLFWDKFACYDANAVGSVFNADLSIL